MPQARPFDTHPPARRRVPSRTGADRPQHHVRSWSRSAHGCSSGVHASPVGSTDLRDGRRLRVGDHIQVTAGPAANVVPFRPGRTIRRHLAAGLGEALAAHHRRRRLPHVGGHLGTVTVSSVRRRRHSGLSSYSITFRDRLAPRIVRAPMIRRRSGHSIRPLTPPGDQEPLTPHQPLSRSLKPSPGKPPASVRRRTVRSGPPPLKIFR